MSANVFGQRSQTMTVNVYFHNEKFNPNHEDCTKVFPTKRVIPRTKAVARAALDELFKGTTDFGTLDLNAAVVALGGTLGTTTLVEGSENLDFDYLYDIPVDFPFIAPPAGSFNANEGGLYSFSLSATRIIDATFLGASNMTVQVVPVPPAAAMGFFGLGLVAFLGRRKKSNTKD